MFQEFSFKQQRTLKICEKYEPSGRSSAVAANNRFGLIAVAHQTGNYNVVSLSVE